VTPLKTLAELPGLKLLLTAAIPELKLTGFYFDKAIFDKKWNIESVSLVNPSIQADMHQEKKDSPHQSASKNPLAVKLPPMMKSLHIERVSFTNGTAAVNLTGQGNQVAYSLGGINIAVNRFAVDSSTRANPSATPLFNAEDITLAARGFTRISKDSLYAFTLGGFSLSTKGNWIRLDTVTMIPRYSRQEFSARLGHQADRMDIRIPRIMVSGVDFRKLITARRLHTERVEVENLMLEDYRDKRVPMPAQSNPLLPAQAIRKITFPVAVDTVCLVNGMAVYEEQTGENPGRIFFDQLNFKITGFSNDTTLWNPSSTLVAEGTTRMVGQAPVEARLSFQLASPADSFTMQASVGSFDLHNLNPMISNLLPVKIMRGRVNRAEIRQFNASNDFSKGWMTVSYQDLGVRIDTKGSDTWGILEEELVNLVADIVLPDNNPNENGKVRTGIIYFQRDKSKGFFNFVWKSTLSGLKSSAGFNSKMQREIRKQEKIKSK
jgi:hypothetical protein